MIKNPENSGKDIIFMLTKDEVLDCALELGISKERMIDDVVEIVKRRLNLEFRHWPEVVKSLLEEATKCPLKLVCYPSCFWWKNGSCTFHKEH